MGKIALIAAALVAQVASGSVAPAYGQTEETPAYIVELCMALVEMPDATHLSLGECVHHGHLNPQSFAPWACDFVRDFDLLEQLGYRNIGECVRSGDYD